MNNWTDKKLDIYEDDSSLEISFKWFSPAAFAILFFCLIWFGFLAFWYSISLTSGAPLIFNLFPLIHVSVGLSLLYYGLCLMFNKTFFHIYEGQLHVVHQPIPWWKGNKTLQVEDIEQLFVKEKKTNGKNGPKFTYLLVAKLRDQKTINLLSIDHLTSELAQSLEKRLEKFLGIQDQTVKGEYGSNSNSNSNSPKDANLKLARQQHRKAIDSAFADLFFAKSDDNIHFQSTPLQVAAIAQYDWNNGNTDKLLQLLDESKKEKIIYIRQQKAILQAFEEQDLMQGQLPIKFNGKAPASSFVFDGKTYFLENAYMGQSFFSFTNSHTDTHQWMYLSEDKKTYLRIQEQNGQLSYSKGSQLEADDFSSPLNINQIPQPKKPEILSRDWEKDELV